MRLARPIGIALFCALLPTLFAIPASAAVTPALNGTTLTFTGDGADDTITLAIAATNLAADLNGDGGPDASFPLASFTTLTVNAGAGNDRVDATGVTGTTVPLTLNGEAGADDLTGGQGADTLIGGDGADSMIGGRGTDLQLGNAGADRFAWSPGDGSDILEGGPDSDVLVFTGANVNENITLMPNGSRALLFRDVAAVTQDMAGVESLDLRLLGGADHFTSSAGVAAVVPFVRVRSGPVGDTLTGGDEVDELIGGPDADTINAGAGDDVIPLGLFEGAGDAIDAGPGNDTLAVTGTDVSESFSIGVPAPGAAGVTEAASGASLVSQNTERVSIEALGGNDSVTMAGAAATALAGDLRGGAGDDTLAGGALADVLRGGDGNDRLDAGGGNDLLFGDAGDDVLLGRSGVDVFACGGVGDTLDATAEDVVGADCLPPPPPASPSTSPPTVPPVAPSAPPADTSAPSVTFKGLPTSIARATLLKRGLTFTVVPSEASVLEAELLVKARGAVISAATPNLSLARRTLGRATGARKLTLKPSRKLIGRAKRFTLTVRVTATDAAGNRRAATRTVKVR